MENGEKGAFAYEGERAIQKGLTKREYFAGLALQGLLAGVRATQPALDEIAVKYADSLLKELDKQK